MANYINLYADMTAYNADSTKQYPNTAKVESENRVLFQRSDPADLRRVICTYNVSSTSSATILLTSATSISKQIIDGVEQSSVVTEYIFDTTGEHVAKYELANNQIGNSTFYNCRRLTSITIPNSVTTIVTYAFGMCTNLSSITIPDSVTSIGDYVFQQCITLANVTVEASTPPSLGRSVFSGNASGRKIYVPAASVEAYKSASGWSTYATAIEAIS